MTGSGEDSLLRFSDLLFVFVGGVSTAVATLSGEVMDMSAPSVLGRLGMDANMVADNVFLADDRDDDTLDAMRGSANGMAGSAAGGKEGFFFTFTFSFSRAWANSGVGRFEKAGTCILAGGGAIGSKDFFPGAMSGAGASLLLPLGTVSSGSGEWSRSVLIRFG